MESSGASDPPLPEGEVSFLFTDIEGSTKLLDRLGDGYTHVLLTHHRLLRGCFTAHGGHEVDTEGDAFFVSFSSTADAVAAAVDAQRALHAQAWPHGEAVRVRMGLHVGQPVVVESKYVGMDVHRAARICSAAHGGQMVLSAQLHAAAVDRLPAHVSVTDLGLHLLKDLPEPEHLLQLDVEGLPHEFPPLRSLRPPTNVPRPTDPLVGRHHELRTVCDLVSRPGRRLVTVTGAGGAGKTRLCAAAALELRDQFTQGVFFVDLTETSAAGEVLPAVARTLGVPFEREGATRSVAEHLGERRTLLVLDNFEQVADAAPDVARLLHACPGLSVLVTSRVLLGIEGEQEYVVPPMSLPHGPSLPAVAASEAVQLFVERGRRSRREFALTAENCADVARICTLLDGLPLAIELAAARTRLFGPHALLTRLGDRLGLLTGGSRDAPARQRTLRSTIGWSFDLLSVEERRSFLELAVFAGGARVESVEAVLTGHADVLGQITALVEKSLLVAHEEPDGEPRFLMLQVVRDYAQELLERDPERRRELRRRHAEHFLDLAEARSASATADAHELTTRDHDNFRDALSWFLEERPMVGPVVDPVADPVAGEQALRLAGALGDYWYHHGQVSEGRAWLDRALAAVPDPPAGLAAKALRMLGIMCEQRQELDRATVLLTQAVALFHDLGDLTGEAKGLNSLGVVARSAGRPQDAERFLHRAVELGRRTDGAGLAAALNNLGILHIDRGDWAAARALLDETLARDREAEDDWGAACTSVNLAVALCLGGEVAAARSALLEAMTTFRRLEDPDGAVEALEAAAGVAVVDAAWVGAARLVGAADGVRRHLDLPDAAVNRAYLDDWTVRTRAALGAAAYDAARAEGAAMTLEQATDYALDEVLGRGDAVVSSRT